MTGNKMATWTVSLLGALALAAMPAFAKDKDQELQNVSVEVSTPKVEMRKGAAPATYKFDANSMRILLDGALYSLSELKNLDGELSIIIDDKALMTGVGQAYRTREEFDAYAASKATSCSASEPSPQDTTSACIFYDLSDCNYTRRVIINCGYAASNLNSFLTVASFSLGCGSTFLCPATDCSGSCVVAQGTAGTCVNISGFTTGCAGCANF